PDFSAMFQRRPRMVGGRLLVSEPSATGATALHLYDVRSGKDVWRKDLAPGSLVLRVEDADLAATLTQEGRLTVSDLRSRRDVLDVTIKREHMEKISEGLVLRDSDQYYLALSTSGERDARIQSASTNLGGLASAPVNRVIYAFRQDDGKSKWM